MVWTPARYCYKQHSQADIKCKTRNALIPLDTPTYDYLDGLFGWVSLFVPDHHSQITLNFCDYIQSFNDHNDRTFEVTRHSKPINCIH